MADSNAAPAQPFSWGNFFSKKPEQQAPNNQQGNQLQNNNNQPNNQSNNNNPGTPQNNETPFDPYANLWKNIDPRANAAPAFDLDDKTISGVADKLNFMQGYDETEMQGLREHFGDKSDAVFKLMNTIGRKAYASALAHGSKVTGKYLDVRKDFDSKATGKQIRDHMVSSSLNSFEVAQRHPIIKQQLQEVGLRLANANPEASPDWVKEKTQEYFKMMSAAFDPQKQEQESVEEKKRAPGGIEFDWDAFSKRSDE